MGARKIGHGPTPQLSLNIRLSQLLSKRLSHKLFYTVGSDRYPAVLKTLPSRQLTTLKSNGLQLAGMIPNDDQVAKLNYLGKPVFELPADSPALKAVEEIAENLGLLSEVTMMKLLGQ